VEPSHLIRVVAAFVAGVVVALGSALIYVRVNETAHPQPTAQVVPITQNAPPAPVSAAASDQDLRNEASPAPAPKAHAKKHKTFAPISRHVEPTPAVLPNEPSSAPVEIAQNTRPAPVSYPTEPAAAPTPQAAAQPHVVTLPAGTNVAIRLGEMLSTDHNYGGDTFRAALESPVIADGFIIADRGSKVLGRIVSAQKAGRIEGVSDLTLALTEINTTDGQRIAVGTNTYEKRGPSDTGKMRPKSPVERLSER